MNDKIIELAWKHGEHNGRYVKMTDNQLQAFARELLAPYVEALNELHSLVLRQEDFNDDGDGLTLERVSKALTAHRELFGDQ